MKSIVIVLILGSVANAIQSECPNSFGNGAVVCSIRPTINFEEFQYDLCTHAQIPTTIIKCENDVCLITASPDEEMAIEKARRYFPNRTGIDVSFESGEAKYLSNRLRRLNTAKTLARYMKDKKLSFILFIDKFSSLDNTEGRNFIAWIEESAKTLHDEGLHTGLTLSYLGSRENAEKYDLVSLSQYMDWFTLVPYNLQTKYLQSFTPLSSPNESDQISTVKFWVEHVLRWVKPECVILYLIIFGRETTANGTTIDPGPGSAASSSGKIVTISNICEKLSLDSSCQENWDEESSTPWAICGDVYYSYDNPRSIKLKTEFAKRYNLSGVGIDHGDYIYGEDICKDSDPIMYLQALQGIRNNVSKTNSL